MKISYKDAGVDITEGNRAVELMKKSIKSTYNENVLGDVGLFSGGYSIKEVLNMKSPALLGATDGVGTKLIVAQMMDKHDTVGIDLVAMSVNDLICQGAKPLFFLDYIATGEVNAEKMADIVSGVAAGCKDSNCALIGGETAEMPGLYEKDEYDLAGFAVGLIDQDNIIDGSRIKPGDVIIGLKSTGLHSNGYSLARKLFFDTMNLTVNDTAPNMSRTIGEALLEPTKIYVKTILKLIEKFDIKGISNVTGGGLIENVPRILPDYIRAVIDPRTWELDELFSTIKNSGLIETKELYRSFNMGIGMVFIVDVKIANEVVNFVNNETDDEAVIIGHVELGDKECRIEAL